MHNIEASTQCGILCYPPKRTLGCLAGAEFSLRGRPFLPESQDAFCPRCRKRSIPNVAAEL